MLRIAIINDTAPTHHYGCMLVMNNLRHLLEKRGAEIIWTWPVGIDWRKHKKLITNKPLVDAIIVNGEGTIHHSASRQHARALSEFAQFSKQELHTNCYLINATLHSNEPSLYQVLQAYKMIYVRVKESLVELNSYGLQGKYVPDLTFTKAVIPPISPPTKEIGVIDTALKQEIPQLKQYCQTNKLTLKSIVVARPSSINILKSPRPFVKNIHKWLRGDYKIATSPIAFIQYLALHKLIITGRYHAVTMCLKYKIPFVAIESNTPKISFLLDDIFHNTSRNINFNQLSSLDIASYSHYTEKEHLSLDCFISNAETNIEQMIDTILGDIK